MKIAYIITRADEYGGAQIHVRDLSKWMKEHGFEPHVIGGHQGIVSDAIEGNGIQFHESSALIRHIHPIKDILAFFQVRKILKNIKPDIVSCHSSKAGMIGRLAAKSLGQKVIFTAHGWAFTEGVSWKKKHIFRAVEWLMAKLGDHIITVSRYDKIIAMQYGVSSAKNMSVVHNGMPYRSTQNNVHNNDIPQLCMVARFSAQKDHTTLLNALGMIDKNKPWHLNLVGNGDDAPYRALVKALDIEDRVTFHGQRTDVPEFLETQDIYLLISHWEGFPRSIIEAMRASLPVIITRTAGSPEAVSQFETGYIVPENDPFKLYRAINLLISDNLRRVTMGEAGRKRYERYFTFDEMAHRTLSIYETVLATKPSKHHPMQEPHPPISENK